MQVSSLEDETDTTATDLVDIRNLSSSTEEWRDKRLLKLLKFEDVPAAELKQLKEFLTGHHTVFSLEEGECGETDIVTCPSTQENRRQSGNLQVACPSSSMAK